MRRRIHAFEPGKFLEWMIEDKRWGKKSGPSLTDHTSPIPL
jgi:hypothetical protein